MLHMNVQHIDAKKPFSVCAFLKRVNSQLRDNVQYTKEGEARKSDKSDIN